MAVSKVREASYFNGLWNLINNEIYEKATRPFVMQQLENLEPLLTMLPALAQLIPTSPRKTNIV